MIIIAGSLNATVGGMIMEIKKNRVTVEIMGQQYTMLGQESEEYLHSIALHVKKMRNLAKPAKR